MVAPLLETAVIGKTHGTDGFLRLYSLSGEYKHLERLDSCLLRTPGGEELTLCVEEVKKNGDLLLIKFKEYQTPETARFLSKSVVLIERDKAPKLKKGEFYIADFVNLDVMQNGKKVGVVEYTLDGSQSFLLAVRRSDNNKIYLVPYLNVYVDNVSLENNTIDLIYPPLLED